MSVTFGTTTTPLTHDAAGRMTAAGAREYGYTPEGHLSTVRDGGKTVAEYVDDATGARTPPRHASQSTSRCIVRAKRSPAARRRCHSSRV